MAPKLGDISKIPQKQKIFLAALAGILIVVGYYYLFYVETARQIGTLQARYDELEHKIKEQRVIASNLPSFQAEVRRLEERLGLLLEQLPNSAEIPSLLKNVSDLGKESGLEFVKFAPRTETRKDFYGEIPVSISVVGDYHSFAVFADKVSHLPRIVNLSDIVFSQPKAGSEGQTLVSIACTATTYRFLEPTAQEAAGKGTKQ